VPTPCRVRRHLGQSPQVESPSFGTPVDPFIPRRTLQHTPPETARKLCTAGLRGFAEIAVQTDLPNNVSHQENAAKLDEDGFQDQPCGQPSCVKRVRRYTGMLMWWMVRVCVANALLMPWLVTTLEESQAQVQIASGPADRTLVQKSTTTSQCEPCLCAQDTKHVALLARLQQSAAHSSHSSLADASSLPHFNVELAHASNVTQNHVRRHAVCLPEHIDSTFPLSGQHRRAVSSLATTNLNSLVPSYSAAELRTQMATSRMAADEASQAPSGSELPSHPVHRYVAGSFIAVLSIGKLFVF
jgi:hypothetical protein